MWVGTEDGLALIDKPSGKVVKTWQEKDGLPFKVVTGIDVDPKTGDVWLGPLRRRPRAALRRPLRPLAPAQQRPRQRRRLRGRRRERQRLGGHHGRRLAPQHGDRGVDGLHREERADGGDLELRRQLRRRGQGLPRGVGQRRPRVHDQDRAVEGVPRPRRRDGDRPLPRRRHQPRDRDRGEPGRRRRLGVDATSAARATTAATGAGYAEQEGGLPSDFNNNIKGRSAQEALYCSDKGLGIVVDGPSDPATWVAYTRDPATGPRPGEGDGRGQGRRGDRHAAGRAPHAS